MYDQAEKAMDARPTRLSTQDMLHGLREELENVYEQLSKLGAILTPVREESDMVSPTAALPEYSMTQLNDMIRACWEVASSIRQKVYDLQSEVRL